MFGVFLLELLNPPGSIHQLLLSGEKGMAGRTDFHLYFGINRAKFYCMPAGTFCHNLMIFWMNFWFHYPTSLLKGEFAMVRENVLVADKRPIIPVLPCGTKKNFGKEFLQPLQLFMEAKNSALLWVCFIFSKRNSMASTGFMEERILRRIQMRLRSSAERSRSSLRVPDF